MLWTIPIDGITARNNYWVKNANGERLKDAYPLSRLKVVELMEPEKQVSYDVELIKDHRSRNGRIE